MREELAKYRSSRPCPDCGGTRLESRGAQRVRRRQERARGLGACPSEHAIEFFGALKLTGWRGEIAAKIVKEIGDRLGFLANVGLGYLTLDRSADTLSGGEAQRIRLASQIGSGLVGVMYILDEPSIGLHQRDNQRLLDTLVRLRDLGNTVIVVEHDEDAIRMADHVVDLGPGAGVHGGAIVAQGTAAEVAANPASITGQYLCADAAASSCRRARRAPDPKRMLKVSGATANNLKNVTAEFPLGLLTCVTGVSGSGKSTLVNDTLLRAVATQLNRAAPGTAQFDRIEGLEHIDRVIEIDQSPIGRTPRSNPATYTGLFAPIREIFAAVPESRARGYEAGRFSFNVKGGRCEACQGDGVIKVEMHFPGGRVRALRCLPGQALQPRDAGNPLQGQEHPGGARHDGRGRAAVLRRGADGGAEAADAARRGAVVRAARPERDHAVGRRGAARQARQGAVEARHRAHAVHSRRADHRPALSPTSRSCSPCCIGCATRATR